MTVAEEIVRLYIADELAFEWRCTPVDLDALVLGRLYAERKTRHSARHVVSLPDPESFAALFRQLFNDVDAAYPDGGMHAAALVRDSSLVHYAADVGRHNSVDKAIGKALLHGDDLAAFGMIVTSRVSGEIARKAANSGIAWLASRSIPTTLAVQHALAAGMPIIGRAAGRNAFIYQ